ncbi:hypothetical protein [Nocardia inohanensis]|nr:hypothetical protein [Nocardia inohanensis]
MDEQRPTPAEPPTGKNLLILAMMALAIIGTLVATSMMVGG